MGGSQSRAKNRNKTKQDPNQASGTRDLSEISAIFPSWEPQALQDVLSTCDGDKEQAIQIVLEWSRADHDGPSSSTSSSSSSSSSTSSSPTPPLPAYVLDTPPKDVIARLPYDKFMRAHLLQHETPQTQTVTLKAATLLIARAHLAKKIVAMRRAQTECLSEVAHPPTLRSFSEEEKYSDEIRKQM